MTYRAASFDDDEDEESLQLIASPVKVEIISDRRGEYFLDNSLLVNYRKPILFVLALRILFYENV